MIHFVTFADSKFEMTRTRIVQQAVHSEFFGGYHAFGEEDLSREIRSYCERNPRGFGFWIWKPIIMEIVLSRIDEGDVFVYCDAGCTVHRTGWKRFGEYMGMVAESAGNVSFEMPQLEKMWTKTDTFEALAATHLAESKQLYGGVIIMRNNAHTRNLVRAFRDTCLDSRHLLDDSPSVLPNAPEFIENRHDQSIFSLLRRKHGTTVVPGHETFYFDGSVPFAETRLKY